MTRLPRAHLLTDVQGRQADQAWNGWRHTAQRSAMAIDAGAQLPGRIATRNERFTPSKHLARRMASAGRLWRAQLRVIPGYLVQVRIREIAHHIIHHGVPASALPNSQLLIVVRTIGFAVETGVRFVLGQALSLLAVAGCTGEEPLFQRVGHRRGSSARYKLEQ